MRMTIYVNHFSDFYFPNMDLKNSKVHYPDLLFLMHMESTYKTVFKTSPTKCALVVLFITFASCKHSKIPPFRFQPQGFRGRWCPVHPKPSQTSLCSELEYNHTPSSLSTVEIGQKTVLPSAHYSHKHSRPCHMAAFLLSTYALAVLRTANSVSQHHIHVFAGGNFAHSDFGASIISLIQGKFSPITQH